MLRIQVLLLPVLMMLATLANGAGDAKLAQNITSLQAYDKLQAGRSDVYLLDVRTQEEYQLVGHPPMAYNIPFVYFSGGPHPNPHFVEDVTSRFKRSDTLLVICRSGGRSAPAADALIRAGFKNTLNVRDGFEGDAFTGRSPEERTLLKKYSPFFEHRGRLEGWQFYGLPFTYDLDDKLVYRSHDQAKHRQQR